MRNRRSRIRHERISRRITDDHRQNRHKADESVGSRVGVVTADMSVTSRQLRKYADELEDIIPERREDEIRWLRNIADEIDIVMERLEKQYR